MNSSDISEGKIGESNQIKFSNNFLLNIKSKYILKQIFDKLQYKILLMIIKYNKKILHKLNVNNTVCKECTEIEIEIIPIKNKFGKFIKINNEEDEKFFHIFFNDRKEEIKRNYIQEKDKVTKIKIVMDSQVKTFCKLFHYCTCIESIYFKKV